VCQGKDSLEGKKRKKRAGVEKKEERG